MASVDQEEHEILSAVRRRTSPTQVDRTRVRLALTTAIVRDAEDLDASDADLVPQPVPTPHPSPLAEAASGAASKMVVVALVAAAGGAGVGYQLGFEKGRSEAPPQTAPHVPAVRTQPAPSHPVLSREAHRKAPNIAEPLFTKPERAAPSQATPVEATRIDSIDEEVRVLARVERAIRDNNPRFALGLLDQLNRSVPNGKLTEERTVAFLVASCSLETSEALFQRASDFASRHASSVYVKRVEQACGVPPSAQTGMRERKNVNGTD